MSLAIRLQTAALDDLLATAKKVGSGQDAALAAARGVRNIVRSHLFNLNVRSPRTDFYAKAAQSVSEAQPEGKGAAIVIAQVGLAQRWLGGDIKAGVGTSSATGGLTQYLAIPARDEAHDKTPGDFDDLGFVPRGNGKAMLVQALQTSIVGSRGKILKHPEKRADVNTTGGLVMFWLVPEVHQEPDASVMPSGQDMDIAARAGVENYLSGLLATGGTNG